MAQQRFSAQPAVLQATIHLGDCLNLLDRMHFEGIVAAYEEVVASHQALALEVPVNSSRGAHLLDRAVIDAYCYAIAVDSPPFQTVRGCFPEGAPVFPGSRILTTKAHVQIAVRDPACIKDVRLVTFE